MIRKARGGWKATTEGGRPLSKKPKSKQSALDQLYVVEMSKHRRKTGGMVSKKARKRVGKRTYGRYA